jgi:predicted ABC-type transport system involved in lysophospholipase L1 biosynthesis ATPase subunit
MSLLSLERISKSYGRGTSRRPVLCEASLELHPGELVAVWGMRRSGRSTLLRIAAGLERPDTGAVRFAGRDLATREGDRMRGAIGFCRRAFDRGDPRPVLDQLVTAQLARGSGAQEAIATARTALGRAGAQGCAMLRPSELGGAEAVRVSVARALTGRPRLLVIDDPTLGVDLLERDRILGLLRSLADAGLGVLTSADRTTGLSGAHRALSLSDGELRGGALAELAPVIPLRRSA